jgi:hypothetical protein
MAVWPVCLSRLYGERPETDQMVGTRAAVFDRRPAAPPGITFAALQRFKEKAHGFSRGMNPTTAETTTTVRIVDCATESRVRICTPAGR